MPILESNTLLRWYEFPPFILEIIFNISDKNIIYSFGHYVRQMPVTLEISFAVSFVSRFLYDVDFRMRQNKKSHRSLPISATFELNQHLKIGARKIV